MGDAHIIEENEEALGVIIPIPKKGISTAASYISPQFAFCSDGQSKIYFGQDRTSPLIL